MANDPYSALGEGFQAGLGNISTIVKIGAAKKEQEREQKKAAFERMTTFLDKYAQVMKDSKGTQLMPLRQAAANGIANIMRQNATELGIPADSIPSEIKFDDDDAKMFSNGIKSLNKMYENKIINRNDYLASMHSLAQTYQKKYGEEDPSIMKLAQDIGNKDARIVDALIGDKKVKLIESFPGSGQFAPMKTQEGVAVEGPAVQRFEMMKPPTESEREKIAQTRTDIASYDDWMATVKKNPGWVGLGRETISNIGGALNMLPVEQQTFVADVSRQAAKDRKEMIGAGQSGAELKKLGNSIPEIGMGPKQFMGAVLATKANKQRLLDSRLKVLRESGIMVPGETDLGTVTTIYNRAKAAGKLKKEASPIEVLDWKTALAKQEKGGGSSSSPEERPPLSAIFFTGEGD